MVQPEIKVETEEEKIQRKQETVGPFMKTNKNWSVEE